MFNEKQSKKNQFTFDISALSEAKKYVKPSELILGKEYPMRGFYKTKDTGYGEAYVIFSDEFLVNASFNSFKYWADIINEDSAAVDCINDGNTIFWVEEYETKFKNKGYRIVLGDK